VRRKYVGIIAAGMLAATSMAVAASPAHAVHLPFPPGANFEIVLGYQLSADLVPNSVICTNTTTNTWTVDWSFTTHSWAPELTTQLLTVSNGGLVPGTKTLPANYPPSSYRDSIFTGTANYVGTADITQTVTYKTLVKSLVSPAGVNGGDNSAEVKLHSPCSPTHPQIPGASRFVALTPERMFDTRPNNKLGADSTVTVPMLGQHNIPGAGVKAVVLNVTAVDATSAGFATVFPTGSTRPTASNLNLDRSGQTTPNLVTVPVGNDGSVSIYSSGGTHILVDVMGYYQSTSVQVRAGRFVALQPDRVVDTRNSPNTLAAGGILTVPVAGHNGVPAAGADAVVLNVTATGAKAAGFVTVYPTGLGVPTTSNLNIDHAGETRANQVVVKLGAGGAVNLFSDGGTDMIVDVSGYFTNETAGLSGSGLFIPVVPGRALDTRGGPKPAAGDSFPVQIAGLANLPAAQVSAVALNVTAVASTNADFVTVWPEGTTTPKDPSTINPPGMPGVSSLNIDVVGQTVPNHVTTLVGSQGEVSIFTHGGAHLLIDILGWYTNGLVSAVF
jgi:hypothetical protein